MQKHIVTCISSGTLYETVLQNVCTCGWKGRKVGVYNNWYPTILQEEASKHITENEHDKV